MGFERSCHVLYSKRMIQAPKHLSLKYHLSGDSSDNPTEFMRNSTKYCKTDFWTWETRNKDLFSGTFFILSISKSFKEINSIYIHMISS